MSKFLKSLVATCLERLEGKYSVTSLFLGGSAATNSDRALDADVCALVREKVMERARIHGSGVGIDLFVCDIERLKDDFNKGGLHQHLVRLFASGKHLYGEKSTSDILQSMARTLLHRPAPAPSKQSVFAHRSRPFNLLRKFQDVRMDDAASAGLIVTELVHSSIEAYFALNRVWTIGIRERMTVIAAHNSQGADALRQVVETPLEMLCEQPQLLETMVRKLVGAEPDSEDVWLT